MKTKYKYIYFEKSKGKFSIKPFYLCKNNKSKGLLGEVFYYEPWQQYVFGPTDDNIFSHDCLADIQDFLRQVENE